MIKGNESDVAYIDFEITDNSKVLHCLEISKNCSNLRNQMSDCNGVWVTM